MNYSDPCGYAVFVADLKDPQLECTAHAVRGWRHRCFEHQQDPTTSQGQPPISPARPELGERPLARAQLGSAWPTRRSSADSTAGTR